MKTETIYFKNINKTYTFYISENETEPFKMLEFANPTDIWFHCKNESSCHVIVSLTKEECMELSKKEKQTIIKRGAFLCKFHTNKLKSLQNQSFMYTQIQDIKKTNKPGCVITENTRTMII